MRAHFQDFPKGIGFVVTRYGLEIIAPWGSFSVIWWLGKDGTEGGTT